MNAGFFLLLAALPLVSLAAAIAAPANTSTMPWNDMVMQLFGGLALFLLGMEVMAAALKAVAGERMKIILARLTTNRVMGAITGALVTAVIQSSSVTTVLIVGFVTANLMSLSQAVGVIMGANIGTTITAQIVAFKVAHYALPMIAVGFAMQFLSKREAMVRYGNIIMGLGLVFFGMSIMGEGMKPLRDYAPFMALMQNMRDPLLGITAAALFTALVQSSSATTGIVIAMASQGLIPLTAGIALIFGANIGTCGTALLACIGKPREALRAAVAHVLFNVIGVLIWVSFIDELAMLVTMISPAGGGLTVADQLAATVPRQIANAHTVFNIANTLVFLGFTGPLARLVQFLVPEKPHSLEPPAVKPKYLDDLLLDTPALALDAVRRELTRMGTRIDDMLREILPAIIDGDGKSLTLIAGMDNEVDALHGFIIEYLGDISKQNLTGEQTHELIRIMEAVNDLENIGDVIETNLVGLGVKRIGQEIRVSPRTGQVLGEIHEEVIQVLREAVTAVTTQDLGTARAILDKKERINELVERAHRHQARRLVAEEPERLAAYTLETDVIELLKRIYYYAKRIAKAVVAMQPPAANASRPAEAEAA